jgi:uncharacterized protein YegP (UPF0339 family)
VIRWTVYRDKAAGWRWRAQSRNSRILADSGESYTRRADADRAMIRFRFLVMNWTKA